MTNLRLDVANLGNKVVELLLRLGILLGHLLILGLPLITSLFERVDFALKVASLDICLTQSESEVSTDLPVCASQVLDGA